MKRIATQFTQDKNSGLFLPWYFKQHPFFKTKIERFIYQLCCKMPFLVRKYGEKDVCFALTRATLLTTIIGIPLLLIIAVFMGFPVNTHIRADFTVNNFSFIVKESIKLNSIKFKTIDISKFEKIALNPSQLEISHANSSWQSIPTMPLVITPKDKQLFYKVTVTALGEDTLIPNAFGLKGFSIEPETEISLEADQDVPRLTFKINNSNGDLAPIDIIPFKMPSQLSKPFKLMTTYGNINTIYQDDRMTFKISLNDEPYINITPVLDALELSFTLLESEQVLSIFADNIIPITALKLFSEDNDERKPETSLVERGTMSYIGHPNIKEVNFEASDLVTVGEEGKFYIEKMEFNPQKKRIIIRLQGIAKYLNIYSMNQKDKENYNLTLYDILAENRILKIIIYNIVWIIPVIIAMAGLILIDRGK
ncbi:MAG: hypothetical protein SVR94_01720 [Pseudomonadota bacterium]|nr:hypothetical protein [Pseudomonadota bacterium]